MQPAPASLQVAEAYAEAYVQSSASGRYVALHWDGRDVVTSEIPDGMTPEDVPVYAGNRMSVSYPWCPKGLRCYHWNHGAARSDIVQCLLESGFADRFAAMLHRYA